MSQIIPGPSGFTEVIGGNTAGVTASISSGTLSLVAGSNLTLSQNGNSITLNAGGGDSTISQFQPFFGGTGGFVNVQNSQNSLSVFPFLLPMPASFCRINLAAGFGFSATASSTTGFANSWAKTDSVGLYSRGTGANSTRIELKFSTTVTSSAVQSYTYATDALSATVTNSFAVSYLAQIDTSGGSTTTSAVVSVSSSSLGAVVNATLVVNTLSAAYAVIPFATSLPAGEYWMALGVSTASSSAVNSRSVVNGTAYSAAPNLSNRNWAFFGLNSTSGPFQAYGVYSVTTAGIPANIGSNEIINSTASSVIPTFMVLVNSAMT